ncbi:glucans biosynthesis glucosyltransferase MdoH [uncultured Mailhella sp.]|uniref:glucans biosynthesis glucosyltransferase MdoH n=1 Tax=uncultured Mailhella sp. TaxID=1981031 RepID=UPI0026298B3B|nr:glucans biosynthesis glucosyltransferase MdoH [uncultured Mailhella sp.]
MKPSCQDMDLRVRDRILLYARGLSLSPKESVALALESLERCTSERPTYTEAIGALHAILKERGLELIAADDAPKLASAPLMKRSSMLVEELDRTPWLSIFRKTFSRLFHILRNTGSKAPDSWKHNTDRQNQQLGWEHVAGRRRSLLMTLILLPSIFGAYIMYGILPAQGIEVIKIIIAVLFAILFGWISIGFWMCVAGIWVLTRKVDRFLPTLDCDSTPIPPETRTAILFPVYNEDTRKYMAGVAATWHSLVETGESGKFDIFILSDSTSPEAWIAEEESWDRFCREENAYDHVFYRRRRNNTKRKSGNVADFCRRWGAKYAYMIVFDADSVMSGTTMVRMVKAMEKHPEMGMLQTPPLAVNMHSLIARVQQFANHLYGPIFGTGFHFWLLGDAQYWGHNAIIRVAPFIRHCQLPTLPGRGPLGGDILSHDFVESALMRRAGYGVWLAYDLGGSWEESPPSLIDELIRDRRWCQGNLQHSRLIFSGGLFSPHRALFINGIMSYASALLWLAFLVFSSIQAVTEAFIPPSYFPSAPTLFPVWPTWYPQWALLLLGSTCVMLFLPKIFAIVLLAAKGGASRFGGLGKVCFSVLGEVLISTMLAPIRMIFHSLFVVSTLLGWKVSWNTQNRSDQGTSWGDAIRFHWWGTLLGLLWGGFMWLINPGFFWWFSPIVFGLVFSIPLSVFTSRTSWGLAARRMGLFITPSELHEAPEQADMHAVLARPEPYSPFTIEASRGFTRAVVIPSVHALHIALVRRRKWVRPIGEEREKARRSLLEQALLKGPFRLSRQEKSAILMDPRLLNELHHKVWALDPDRGKDWGVEQS